MNCPHCGSENPETAKFCQNCGGNLTIPPERRKETTGLQSNVAGLLCYLLGWVTGLIFLLIEKEDQLVRFHAMQSLITFGSLTLIIIAVSWIPLIGVALVGIAGLVSFVLWIVLMVKAFSGERYKLPVIGDLAERQIGAI